MRTKDLSGRALSLRLGRNAMYVRDLINRGYVPKHPDVVALADILDTTPEYLTGATDNPAVESQPLTLQRIWVRGDVQAGVWRNASEWPDDEWYPVPAVPDPRYPQVRRFGLVVKGTSMDQLYPDGTVLICASFIEVRRPPRTGEKVIVQRRRHDEIEATVKEFRLADDGTAWLVPRSSDPRHQAPIPLPGNGHHFAGFSDGAPSPFGHFPQPGSATAGAFEDADDVDEVAITALVIASYRPE